jgi:hypothetical protein
VPQIIVTADKSATDNHEHAVMFTERVSVDDFESDHFQAQLVERLGWAVGDAHNVEQAADGGTSATEDLGSSSTLPQLQATLGLRPRTPQR